MLLLLLLLLLYAGNYNHAEHRHSRLLKKKDKRIFLVSFFANLRRAEKNENVNFAY